MSDKIKPADVGSTLVGMEPIDFEEPLPPEQAAEEGGQPAPPPPELKPVLRPRKVDEPAFLPAPARSVQATGLSYSYLEELCLKHIFQGGDLKGSTLARRLHLPSSIIEEIMERLRRQQLVDIRGSGGAGIGRSSMIFTMTEDGHKVCSLSMERDRYVGPAPVPYRYYLQAVAAQTIRGSGLQREDIEPHFRDLVVPDEVFAAIGPAMNSGKALFFYGPPGNGKTAICQRMTNCFGGDVFIPHALIIDDFVVKVFDSTIHKPIESDNREPLDRRWVRCRRPMVTVGGELTLDDLELAYSPQVKYYEAPFQLKANCGMLLIDDFGRQKVEPKDLLNRWIVPLESEFDFLTMHTGKKLQVPFDVFVVFSTNLDPASLVDRAFLRRVRYKLEVSQPDRPLFSRIFEAECEKQGVSYDPEMLRYLIETHYVAAKREFNACEPRDLLAQIKDLSAYRGLEPKLSAELIDRVVANYFVRFDGA